MGRIGTRRRRTIAGVGVVALALVAAACGSSGTAGPSPPTASSGAGTTTTSATATGPTGPVAANDGTTLWLCRPGIVDNPCDSDLTTSVVHPDGSITIEHDAPAADPPVDCFYVYPTVSLQSTVNATMTVGPEERSVAVAQAARFSQVCRVYAPIYRQITVHGLFSGKLTGNAVTMPYADVLRAWKNYLAHDNDGRGVILIGHSQGSFVLEQLIEQEIDPDPAARRLLVSAILLGGNVVVPAGGTVGGTFAHVPACRIATQTSCVVAYSSFNDAPPVDSMFGRTNKAGDQVLCVNPAAPAGGGAPIDSYYPTTTALVGKYSGSLHPTTPWIAFPGAFSAQCVDSGGASWLQIDPRQPVAKGTPPLVDALGPTWGLHLIDVNLALGDLVDLARTEASAWVEANGR